MIPERECPLCGQKNVKKIYHLYFPNNININHLPEEHSIVYCNNCSLIYNDFNIDICDFDKYYQYNSTYKKNYNAIHTENYERYKDFVLLIEKYIDKFDNILDIGCGNGTLLSYLHNNGYKKLNGMDESDALKRNHIHNDINFIFGSIYNINFKNKFKLIILNHVLEHLVDLKKALSNIKNILDDDGYIYISFPNMNEYKNNYETPFFHLSYEHISHFSKEAVINLANLYGFKVIEINYGINSVKTIEIRAILQKTNITNNKLIKNNCFNIMQEYIFISENKINNLIQRLKYYDKLILWGLGSTTLLLLSKLLNNINIIGIVDSLEARQGHYIEGIKIISPNEIDDQSCTIIILPELSYDSIYRQIKEIGLKNKVVFLTDQTRPDQTRPDQT